MLSEATGLVSIRAQQAGWWGCSLYTAVTPGLRPGPLPPPPIILFGGHVGSFLLSSLSFVFLTTL